jgi:hypothetical protein
MSHTHAEAIIEPLLSRETRFLIHAAQQFLDRHYGFLYKSTRFLLKEIRLYLGDRSAAIQIQPLKSPYFKNRYRLLQMIKTLTYSVYWSNQSLIEIGIRLWQFIKDTNKYIKDVITDELPISHLELYWMEYWASFSFLTFLADIPSVHQHLIYNLIAKAKVAVAGYSILL